MTMSCGKGTTYIANHGCLAKCSPGQYRSKKTLRCKAMKGKRPSKRTSKRPSNRTSKRTSKRAPSSARRARSLRRKARSAKRR